ncbi:MAG: cytochrome c oxidase subunit II [Gammaproteobacteria bacterium]|nr:cytochrome c oxidase subunit II [Gammaproteobacteria bacterium]
MRIAMLLGSRLGVELMLSLGKSALRALAAAAGLFAYAHAHADWATNLPRGVTEISSRIYDLHMLVLGIVTVIGVLVFAVLTYALIAFRKKPGVASATWDHSNLAEFIWTVIPFFVMVGLAIPAAQALILIEDTSGSELTVKITGYQWKWQYEYVGKNYSFYSTLGRESNVARQKNSGRDPYAVDNYLLEVDRPLVLPAGVKIRYLITSNDVNHAWWVPDFGVKRDAIPGYMNEGWFQVDRPGTYRGQCAELCGKDHGFMPIVVEVIPESEFDAWLRQQVTG